MQPKYIDLRPDRKLLDPNFDGYKLSLQEIPKVIEDLDISVDRCQPDENQYSLLHAKLYGLHNNLIGESCTEHDSVYFVDSKRNINKMFIDPFSSSLFERYKLWEIPANRDKKLGDYNVSLCFASDTIAIVSDGCGILHIIDTGKRDEHSTWNVLFSDEVIGKDQCFLIKDAVCVENESENRLIHCLLLSVEQENDKFNTIVNWITFREANDKSWSTKALRKLQCQAGLHYCYLERSCNAIYAVSEKNVKFIEDSENPIQPEEQKEDDEAMNIKTYIWLQSKEDITIKFKLPNDYNKELLTVHSTANDINIFYSDKTVVKGKLMYQIDSDLTTWSVQDGNAEVTLFKLEEGLIWSEIVEGDSNGELVLDSALVEEVHQRLAHLCSENEVTNENCGPTFNSQQVEECDYADTKSSYFSRICAKNHKVTHSADLGSHHVLLEVKLSTNLAPALCVRYDVDACVWQPNGENDNFTLKHEGTLLAFGYVQASKQQRKFSACSPDLSYSVISESSRHIFIYRQNKAVTGGELRHRTTGRRVGTIAQQQVVSIGDQEVLGLYASPSNLYILTNCSLFALKM